MAVPATQCGIISRRKTKSASPGGDHENARVACANCHAGHPILDRMTYPFHGGLSRRLRENPCLPRALHHPDLCLLGGEDVQSQRTDRRVFTSLKRNQTHVDRLAVVGAHAARILGGR
jgi:hypothetical protein